MASSIKSNQRICTALGCALVTTLANLGALAQSYPVKPIRVIVPVGVGGPPDIAGRMLAQKMSENLGQPLVIENRLGAGGTIGGQVVVKAAPDGYTLMMGSGSSLVIGPTLFPAAAYSPTKSFSPISLVSHQPFVFGVASSLKTDTLRDFIVLVRANPGKYNYGSTLTGSPPNMSGEWFKRKTGLDLVHIPFGGSAKAVTAMAAGDAHLYIEVAPVFLAQVSAGRIKILATASAKRSPFMPEVPTTAEAGLPDYEIGSWNALLGPLALPRALVTRLNTEVHKAMASKELQEGFAKAFFEIQLSTPEELGKFMASELEKWSRLIADAGIKAN
ncbi:MAG: Bug family tripartite tricarboxylate transporter substrate binding protein [Burkholderiales bacterium]